MPQAKRHLSLFAGIGGFEQGIRIASFDITTKQFVELDPDAQAVLLEHYPNIPIHSDIRDFSPRTEIQNPKSNSPRTKIQNPKFNSPRTEI
ncbi:DNA cytosine methyltransferase [Scytonema sp. PCC 10023]|uniref:DNA cytosine methyltransferase n=1 Tax=Scytonema sp. PCC 10023 TaxID=1680591 RepID=UPI0039C71FF6